MPSTNYSTPSPRDADILRSIVAFLYENNIYDAIPPILLSTNIGFLDSSLESHQELMSLQKLVLNGKFEDALGKGSCNYCPTAKAQPLPRFIYISFVIFISTAFILFPFYH